MLGFFYLIDIEAYFVLFSHFVNPYLKYFCSFLSCFICGINSNRMIQ